METKICSTCKQALLLSSFGKQKKCKDGLNRQCKKCIHLYYVRTREHKRQYTHNYYLQHQEFRKQQNQEWKKRNQQRRKEVWRRYYEAKREDILYKNRLKTKQKQEEKRQERLALIMNRWRLAKIRYKATTT